MDPSGEARKAPHLDPRKFRELPLTQHLDISRVAHSVELDGARLQQALDGQRALGRDVYSRIERKLGLQPRSLECRGGLHPEPGHCPCCPAANLIEDDELADLTERLRTFLKNAVDYVASQGRSAIAIMPSAWAERAGVFEKVEGFRAAQQAARYLGGDLKAIDMADTGVAALLGSGKPFDSNRLSLDLARFAARGDCHNIIHVALDIEDLPRGPIPVAGWQLRRYTPVEIRELTPIPQAAEYSRS